MNVLDKKATGESGFYLFEYLRGSDLRTSRTQIGWSVAFKIIDAVMEGTSIVRPDPASGLVDKGWVKLDTNVYLERRDSGERDLYFIVTLR